MATAISPDNYQSALGECYDALSADNITSARKWYALAEIQLNGLAASSGFAGDVVSLRKDLSAVKKAIDDYAAASGAHLFERHSRGVI